MHSALKNTLVIGLNALYHDTGVVSIDVEGKRIFGMSTERITRYKHDGIPPIPVIRELINAFDIRTDTIEKVVVATTLQSQGGMRMNGFLYETEIALRNFLKAKYADDVIREKARFERLSCLQQFSQLFGSLAGRHYMRQRLCGLLQRGSFTQVIASEVSRLFPKSNIKVAPFDHHIAHAYSSFVLAGYPNSLMVTLDGWGDGFFSKAFVRDGDVLREISASSSLCVRKTKSRYSLHGQVAPHILGTGIFDDLSLGHFYSIVTWLLGFEPVSDEGKVEALAAYGSPDNDFLLELERTMYLDTDQARLVIDRDAALGLFHNVPKLQEYLRRFGPEAIAAAMQRFLEERVIGLIGLLLQRFPRSSVVLSGGCTANVILNMHLFESVCPNIYVVPAMGDDGAAFGSCALALQELGVTSNDMAFLRDHTVPYYGNRSSRKDVERALIAAHGQITFEDRGDNWPEATAKLLADGKIGAVFEGRMEWGPRALGNRSILANPCLDETRAHLNKVVKKRPFFQPFCPAILIEERERLFERAYNNRHMTCAFRLREEFRSQLPGGIHVDGTARVQFVSADDNAHFHRILTEFKRLSGFGVIINTSFNLHGRPIVNTPEDAICDFLDSKMDFLMLEGYFVQRRKYSSGDCIVDEQREFDDKCAIVALSER